MIHAVQYEALCYGLKHKTVRSGHAYSDEMKDNYITR